MIESYSDDDPDFSPQRGKRGRSTITCIATDKQRTLSELCSESNSGRGNKSEKTTTEHRKQSKATNLASYLLSQQSQGGASTSTSRSRLPGTTAEPSVQQSQGGSTTSTTTTRHPGTTAESSGAIEKLSTTVDSSMTAAQRTTASTAQGAVSVRLPCGVIKHTCTKCQSKCTCQLTDSVVVTSYHGQEVINQVL